MGLIQHNAIIVSCHDAARLQQAHAKAESCRCAATPIVPHAVNGGGSFLVVPDGSKEGWDESDAGDVRRSDFLDWLNRQRFSDASTPFDWVEVSYGELNPKIVHHHAEIEVSDDYTGPHDLDE